MITNPGDAKATLYLSEKRTMFIGRLEPELSQSTAASTLMLSLDKFLEITPPNSSSPYRTRSLLIPAGSKVTINTHDSLMAVCYLDTMGRDLAILKSKMQNPIAAAGGVTYYADLADEKEILESAYHLYEFTSPAEFALKRLESWIGEPTEQCERVYDPRVERAVELIKSSILENTPVEQIASQLNLSVPRLSQIFKQVTGIPIRRFRLWHRIFITTVKMAWGMSLTEASVSSGFSDSAHFSRVFKEISGVKPSKILNSRGETLILMLPPTRKIQSRKTVTDDANS